MHCAQMEWRLMETTLKQLNTVRRWGIYHAEREFAREMGDPCLGVVNAQNKHEAEIKAWHSGFSGPTGIWAHPLPETPGRHGKVKS